MSQPDAPAAIAIGQELAGLLGWPDAPWDRVSVTPSATALATWMPIADMAAAAQALIGLAAARIHEIRGGPAQTISVDRFEASLSMTPAAYLLVNGARGVVWDPLTGYFPAADGWVYLHCQFAHLRDGLLAAFDLPNDADQVRAALSRLPAQEIEDRAASAGVCAIRRRDRAEWEAHPQAEWLARNPVIALERTDGPAAALPAVGEAPLSGLRVLDLSRVIAGPTMGRVLAEHGAEVIRISAPDLPAFESLVIETGFGKRAAFADLKTAAGRKALSALVRAADVIIDGYRPGALTRRGFGANDLARMNPGLVQIDLSAFGAGGPWGGRRGYDTYVQAATGLSTEGRKGPGRLPCQPLDYLSGYFGAAAAMVALARRHGEGGGWRIRLALARTAMWLWEQTDRLGPEPNPPAANPADPVALRWQMPSSFGTLSTLRPAVGLSHTPPRWRSAPVALGSHPPEWADEGATFS